MKRNKDSVSHARKVKKTAIESSVMSAIAWTPNADNGLLGTLRVWFISGNVWDYQDVPDYIPYALHAGSKGLAEFTAGEYFNRMIKGQYYSIQRHGYRARRVAA